MPDPTTCQDPPRPAPAAATTLSVLIPAYNEADCLAATIERLRLYLGTAWPAFEIVVADDGSTDATWDEIERVCAVHSEVHGVRLDRNLGKGGALRAAFEASHGDAIVVMDADGATDLEAIPRFARAYRTDRLLVGSRMLPSSDIRTPQPLVRRVLGRGFALCVRILTGVSQNDTQCGFKLFPRRLGERYFAVQRVSGFAWDVELIHVAHAEMGMEVIEAPVVWTARRRSSVSLLRDPPAMLRDVLRIVVHRLRGSYRPPASRTTQ